MAATDAPAEPIDVLAGHRLTAAREATPEAIDTARYAEIPAGQEPFYLAALGALQDSDDVLAIYATADGACVKSLQQPNPPHAVGGLRRPRRRTQQRHSRRMVATLSEIVARAHPEVER